MKIEIRRHFVWMVLSAAIALSTGCTKKQVAHTETETAAQNAGRRSAVEPHAGASDSSAKDIELVLLKDNIWIHRSYAEVPPWGRVSANGLLVVGKDEALLIDTPWNDSETSWLFSETKKRFHVPITKVIVTHAHDDNLGGLNEAHRLGAHSYAEQLTVEAAKAAGKPVPEESFSSERTLDNAASMTVELFYPGPGHTRDNIAVFLKEAKVLFGGCLIKAAEASSMGNTAEANMDYWASSVDALEARFPNAEIVVPGHGGVGDRSLFAHTRNLISSHKR